MNVKILNTYVYGIIDIVSSNLYIYFLAIIYYREKIEMFIIDGVQIDFKRNACAIQSVSFTK